VTSAVPHPNSLATIDFATHEMHARLAVVGDARLSFMKTLAQTPRITGEGGTLYMSFTLGEGRGWPVTIHLYGYDVAAMNRDDVPWLLHEADGLCLVGGSPESGPLLNHASVLKCFQLVHGEFAMRTRWDRSIDSELAARGEIELKPGRYPVMSWGPAEGLVGNSLGQFDADAAAAVLTLKAFARAFLEQARAPG